MIKAFVNQMIEHIIQILAVTLSLVSMTIGYTASYPFTTDNISKTEPAPVIYFGTVDSEEAVTKLVTFLQNTKNPERFQLECNEQKIAKSCYYYASYHDLVLKDSEKSYGYYKKAFDLGIKQAGYFIGVFQINFPEIFTDDNRLSIDENINYLKQASDAGSPDATRLLMLIYRKPEYNRLDYDQAEYYNKLAIKQNVKYARYTLAFLYTHHLKDKSKIDDSIELYKEDLIIEKNWESSYALAGIYLNPEKFGAELDYVKALAYAYVTRDLRKNLVNDFIDDQIPNDENDLIELLPRSLTPEQLKQAKALYLELMAKINSQHETQ